jgi:SAM-dependent methyltransferase
MARCWTEDAGPGWIAERVRLDERLEPFGQFLIEGLEPQPGESILDVGCGTGASTLKIARSVGGDGAVVAVDVSSTMLDAARKRPDIAEDSSSAPITWITADAQTYSFKEASFDAIASRFGVMFFEDPVAAFRNLRNALRTNGRLTFVCWQPPALNQWIAGGADELGDLLEFPPPSEPNKPGPFGLCDSTRTHALLDAAGFTAIEIDGVEAELPFSGTVDDMVTHQLSIGPIGAAVRAGGNDPTLRGAVRKRLHQIVGDRAESEGLAAPASAWLVRAQK